MSIELKSPFSQRFTSLLEKSVEKSRSWFEVKFIVSGVKIVKKSAFFNRRFAFYSITDNSSADLRITTKGVYFPL